MIFSRIAKHSIVYGLVGPVSALSSIVLVPIYTRYLTQKEFAILELYLVTGSFLSVVFNFGMGAGIFKVVLYDDDGMMNKSSLLGTAFVFLLITSTCFCMVLWLFSAPLTSIFGSGLPNSYLLVLLISTAFEVLSLVPMTSLRIDERSGVYARLVIARSMVGFLASVYFVVVLGLGIRGILASLLIQSLLLLSTSYLATRRSIKLVLLVKPLIEILKFSVPLVPMGLAMLVMNMSDRYFLNAFSTKEELATYTLGYKVSNVLLFGVSAFQLAWPPYLFAWAKLPQAHSLYSRALTYVVVSLGLLGLMLSTFSNELVELLAPASYAKAADIIPLIVLSNLLVGVFYATSVGTNLRKKTHLQSIAVVIGAGVNTLVNFMLIPTFGSTGAAVSTLIAFSIMTWCNLRFSLSLYRVAYEWRRISLIAVGCVLVWFVNSYIHLTSSLTGIMFKLMGILLFLVILYCIRFFEKDEIDAMKSFVQSVFKRG